MSTPVFPSRWPFLCAAILFVVLLAGCTAAPPGPAPVTTLATPAATIDVPATPVPQTTAAPTPAGTTPVPATTSPPLPGADVTIANFLFSPASITVPVGTTVTWTNRDSAPHSIVSDAGTFSGRSFGNGQSFSFTFTEPGSYPYHCGIHTTMHGTVTVM